MAAILNKTITTAAAAVVGSSFQMHGGPGGQIFPANVMLQANFTYGSGGTSADVWVQTSFDGGGTWNDVANFHFTTSSLRAVYNLSSLTPVTTQYTATDGTLAANTSKDGCIGPLWRTKTTTVGTYATSTTLRVDMITNGVTTPS